MKRKRRSRAKNKIEAAPPGTLINTEQERYADAPAGDLRKAALVVRRSTLLNAELEEAIDLIARERVYRAMLAALGRRLLMAPAPEDFVDEMPGQAERS